MELLGAACTARPVRGGGAFVMAVEGASHFEAARSKTQATSVEGVPALSPPTSTRQSPASPGHATW